MSSALPLPARDRVFAVAFTAAIAVALCIVTIGRADELPAKHFAHPDRIRYDGQCLTVDGRDTFIFSGAFHYFRTPKALWRERFQKIKDAHFNAVETYVPWNLCERNVPADVNDVSQIDLTDLKDWMRMAHDEFGLYTIIRPGPYICAEWQAGGLPLWLWTKKADLQDGKGWIRSDDPTYLAWSKHWYDAVIPAIAAEQITRRSKGAKGVILVQIENEYDYWGTAPSAKVGQLKFLYKTATDDGIDVPIFTCVTREVRASHDPVLSQAFDSSNFYHRWGLGGTVSESLKLRASQPNAPTMVTELQGGWFAEAGGQLSEDQGGIEPAQTNAITLTAIANNATVLNYYMLVGGSNFGGWGSGPVLQTYDYFAPIRENGGCGEKYEVVKAIGAFLAEHGSVLARSSLIKADVAPADGRINVTVRATPDGQHFVFVRNSTGAAYHAKDDIKLADGTTLSIDRQLPARLTEVLYLPTGMAKSVDGTWGCEPAPQPDRPAVAEHVRVANAFVRNDPGPTTWQPIARNTSLIKAGVTEVDDVVYRARPKLSVEQAANFSILKVSGGEAAQLLLSANGTIVSPKNAGHDVTFSIGDALHEGENQIDLLYQNRGLRGFGGEMNWMPGVHSMTLLPKASQGRPLEDWRVALLKPGQKPPVSADVDDSSWDKVVLNEKTFAELAASKQPGHPPLTYRAMTILNGKNNTTAVYRTAIDLTEADLSSKPIMIDLQRIDDEGDIYVNGQLVGTSKNWRDPFTADISRFVRAGRNVIAVAVRNVDYDGGLLMPVSLYSQQDMFALDAELGRPFAGVAEQWCGDDATAGDWKPVALDTTSALPTRRENHQSIEPSTALAKWIRTEFDLPASPAGVWAPWSAVIAAEGNGFVYLNGHNLGRFFDAGPQRQFYLPECWLKTGPGHKNVLTLLLHPSAGGAELRGLELRQYAAQAEQR